MKISIDATGCRGHGQCVIAAPEVFDLNDEDVVYLLVDEVADDGPLKDRVLEARQMCPEQIIFTS
ncbi:ferredoxin [Nocardioides sp.]|uniref:ferredoxin n=1 Tax=Nocardioides sp. TaxID=35761 RepID=UPI003D0C92C2